MAKKMKMKSKLVEKNKPYKSAL
jgi:plasmid rolling circle replication initiator protein Rep